jgi:hypothetical protein
MLETESAALAPRTTGEAETPTPKTTGRDRSTDRAQPTTHSLPKSAQSASRPFVASGESVIRIEKGVAAVAPAETEAVKEQKGADLRLRRSCYEVRRQSEEEEGSLIAAVALGLMMNRSQLVRSSPRGEKGQT